jgi:DNA invertase Pin-like site-specific DNA recombinase
MVFEEAASGANIARPVLAQTLAELRAGDTLVVCAIGNVNAPGLR